MSQLQRMRSSNHTEYEDNGGMTGTDEESYSDNDERKNDSKSKQPTLINKNSDDYKKRRQRNNEAVRKSRERAKKNYAITEARVIKLRQENRELEIQKNGKKKELDVLQDLARNLNLPEVE